MIQLLPKFPNISLLPKDGLSPILYLLCGWVPRCFERVFFRGKID